MTDTKEPRHSTARSHGLAPGWMVATEKETGGHVYVWAPALHRMRGDDEPKIDGALVVEEDAEELQRRHVAAMLRWKREQRRAAVREEVHAREAEAYLKRNSPRVSPLAQSVQELAGDDAAAPKGTTKHLAYSLALACVSWGIAATTAVDYGRNLAQAASGDLTPDDIFDSLTARRSAFPSSWDRLDHWTALALATQLHATIARHFLDLSQTEGE